MCFFLFIFCCPVSFWVFPNLCPMPSIPSICSQSTVLSLQCSSTMLNVEQWPLHAYNTFLENKNLLTSFCVFRVYSWSRAQWGLYDMQLCLWVKVSPSGGKGVSQWNRTREAQKDTQGPSLRWHKQSAVAGAGVDVDGAAYKLFREL